MKRSYKEIQMLKLNRYAREYIDNYSKKIDYQKITEQMREFSNAEFVIFNILDNNGKDFTIVGIDGNKRNINKAIDIIGYNIIGKNYVYKEGKNEKFEKSIVTKIKSLKEVEAKGLPNMAIKIIEKEFPIDHILVVRIKKNENTIGSFVLIFYKNQNNNDNEMLKLFASQVGLFIEKKKDEQKIIDIKKRQENIIKGANLGTWEHNIQTGEDIVNEKWAEMLGYSIEEISTHSHEIWEKSIHPDDKKRAEKEFKKLINKEKEFYDIELRMKHKNGKWIWINDRGIITKWSKEGKALLASGTHIDITKKKKDEQKIIEIKENLESVIEGTNAGIWKHNIQTGEDIINDKWAEMIGYTLEELSPVDIKKLKGLTHPDDLERIEKETKKLYNKEIEHYNVEFRIRHKNGKWIWLNAREKVVKWSEDGRPLVSSGIHTDITEKKESEENLKKFNNLIEYTIKHNTSGVAVHDKKMNFMYVSEKYYNIFNIEDRNIIGKYHYDVFPDIPKKWINIHKRSLEGEVISSKEDPYYKEDGSIEWTKWESRPWYERDGSIGGIITYTEIITEQKEKQKKIEYLSFHDHLTGLYNRRYMEDSIKRLDTDRNIPFSIMVADINGLKLTNDVYGHEMGDKLLITAAEILKKSCRKEDIVCRVGGDEFVILLPNIGEKKTKEIIERINKESKNINLDSVIVSLAIGYSTKKKQEENILEVHKEADNRMYKNKIEHGRIMRSKTIETLLININNKYDNEQNHTERTSQYCENIAKAMKLSKKEIEDAKIAGILHDIGKITVSPDILNKKEKLTDREWEEIKKHSTISYQLLKNVDEYSQLAEAVLYHHERLDGKGYPEGLVEDEIPLLSKIIAVADAYEAMTADRPYKNKKTKEEAIEELKKHSGTQFDKGILDVFINEVL